MSFSLKIKKAGLLLVQLVFFGMPVIYARDYNILDFGAVADSSKLSTEAINLAIVACNKMGGGRVVIPTGQYRSGTVILMDNVELHLERGAILYASTSHADFPRQKQPSYRSQKDVGGWYALIYAEQATNIGISGYGTIEGQGERQQPRFSAKDWIDEDRDGRPRNILFISCKNISVRDVVMRNSGIWNQHYLDCENVIIDKITVYNHSTRNNDAIDIDGCRQVILSNSIFDSDDDGITLKSTGLAPCENITVINCIISSYASAIKCGTESTGGFKNIRISGCIIKPSKSIVPPVFPSASRIGKVGIALEIVDGGTMDGVMVDGIVIEGTECPVFVRLGNRARKHVQEANSPPIGIIRNISISNITAYNTGNYSSSITGIPGGKIENITLHNIQVTNLGGLKKESFINDFQRVPESEKSFPSPDAFGVLPSYGFFVRHVGQVSLSNITLRSANPEMRNAVIADDVESLVIDQLISGNTAQEVILKNVKQYKRY